MWGPQARRTQRKKRNVRGGTWSGERKDRPGGLGANRYLGLDEDFSSQLVVWQCYLVASLAQSHLISSKKKKKKVYFWLAAVPVPRPTSHRERKQTFP